ncbi:MAG TPA: ATP-binding protein, partial [Opitutus sp.]|nr:ATP-binding protein [Opitutus sp.]
MAVVIVAAALLIGRLLRSMVIARLESAHAAVRRIGDTSDLSVRLPAEGSDELSGLSAGINRMLEALARGEAQRVAAEQERERLRAQLQHVQKMEAIGTLAGGLAHDFNNLLTSIQGSSTLIRLEGQPSAINERHLRRIEQATSNAVALVRQMMAFGRRNPTVFAHHHLGKIVQDALQLLRSSIPRTIEFEVIGDEADDVVHGDAGQLQQVLVNLGTNASQAMAGGRGRFTIAIARVRLPDPARAETANLSGEYLRLSVSDTGCGIEPENLQRVFEPFYTTKPVGSGTGLGLAVVHGIISHHHGTIAVESEVGRGTTFVVHLPKADSAT